ncbi:hypothetical protein RIR_jg14304.t1 [Rhizophagus irregularis DAOM 181602=DAOM 197198]|nr:hypothetical protein RIR_jg14304.t1 [Rhizophagus irregularis DAOM 181602=DAOM 197198]
MNCTRQSDSDSSFEFLWRRYSAVLLDFLAVTDFPARCIMASFFWVFECGFRRLSFWVFERDIWQAVFQVSLDLEYRSFSEWFFDTLWSLDIMIKQHPDIEVYG